MQPRVPELNFDLKLLALVSVNNCREICALVPHSCSFFSYQWCEYNPWHPCVKAQNLFTHVPLPFFPLFPFPPCIIPLFSTSFPWPQGAVSYLDAGAPLWALIDCLRAPHSQSGQSAWGPGCLPYLPLLSCHTLRKKTEEKWREREFI